MFRRRLQRIIRVSLLTIITFVIFVAVIHFANEWIGKRNNIMNQYEESEFVLDGLELNNGKKVKADLLTPNPYSRPETKIKSIQGIVIHYVGNPKTTAQNNRDYFEGLATKQTTYASSHFVVGLKGEMIQCIPLNEVAYCSNDRNEDTISIEVCHPSKSGKFKKNTYKSVVQLTAYLCNMFDLNTDDVIRHYDVTGKLCPLYYVEHEDAWVKLKSDVDDAIKKMKSENTTVDEKNK